jgi:hypothetical protein
VTGIPAEGLLFPKRYLSDNPTHLTAQGSAPQRRGHPWKHETEEP